MHLKKQSEDISTSWVESRSEAITEGKDQGSYSYRTRCSQQRSELQNTRWRKSITRQASEDARDSRQRLEEARR